MVEIAAPAFGWLAMTSGGVCHDLVVHPTRMHAGGGGKLGLLCAGETGRNILVWATGAEIRDLVREMD